VTEVIGLGYVVIEARDLDAWASFASDLLGLQIASRSDDRLLLRLDDKSYRLDIRRGEVDAVTVLGWEVKGPNELSELAERLERNGYAIKRADAAAIRERQVSALIEFEDPDGSRRELFYGSKRDSARFVSPTAARFVTGTGGLGHAFQMVTDAEAFRQLYVDILGFKLTDYIEFGGGYGTFLHANPRHHSFAFAAPSGIPARVGHLMFEVDDIDLVGRAYDKVLEGAAPLALSFGKHTNDEMLSFYVTSPSGFSVEYGFGGRLIDDSVWAPDRYDTPSYWGHKRQVVSDEPDV